MEIKPINRNALVISPKKAMLDWINTLSNGTDNVVIDLESHDEANVYLLKETANVAASLKWLQKNFQEVFAEELFAWWTDESVWPPMTWKNFELFCHYRIHTCVYDTVRGGIKYDF